MLAGRRPSGEVEGKAAALLGKLADFCDALFGYRERIGKPRGLDAWRRLLGEIQGRMLASNSENIHQHQRIREALEEIADAGTSSGYQGEVDLETFRDQLARGLDRDVPTGAFLSGGVTFCELVPMRTIPFRVVCLMGMSDDAFPRIRQPMSFDLMTRRRMAGDRTSRDDDRYLFLEALLSARDHLIITFVGRDLRDNEPRPPSVLVGELLDYVTTTFVPSAPPPPGTTNASAMREAIVVGHKLQPFSPSYFTDDAASPHFSYSSADLEAARALTAPRCEPRVFVDAPLALAAAEDDEATREIELEHLQRFFQRPVEMFMRDRLSLYLADEEEAIESREPAKLEMLDLWTVGEMLLENRLCGGDPSSELGVLRAEGRLPLGVGGICAYADVALEVSLLETRVLALRAGGRPISVDVDLAVAGARLVGRLDDVYPAGQIRHGFARLGQRSEIGCWIRHLALCCVAPEGIQPVSYMVGRPEAKGGAHRLVTFARPEDPEAALASVVEAFALGMRAPLPFFPKASRRYAAVLRSSKSDDPEANASKDAYLVYKDQIADFLEVDDPYNQLAFSEIDPLSPSFHAAGSDAGLGGFRALALSVVEPMLAHREESA